MAYATGVRLPAHIVNEARLQEVGHAAEEQARAAAGSVNGNVHEHSWTVRYSRDESFVRVKWTRD
jgi:hypothetical protein